MSPILQRCLEEKMEILQGKISLLEDQLAKLTKETSSLPVKGEVLGDVLKVGVGQPRDRPSPESGSALSGCQLRFISGR